MDIRNLTRHIKRLLLNPEGDISELLFHNKKTQHACRLFLQFLKTKKSCTREELSQFATDLQNGKIEKDFSYSRAKFYYTIRATLLTLGLIQVQERFFDVKNLDLMPERSRKRNVQEVYVPVKQPIPKMPPDGVNLPRFCWIICKAWNDEFLPQPRGEELQKQK
jgi:hypothetical protein